MLKTIVVLIASCVWCISGLHKFMGFYTVNDPLDLCGWANSYYSDNVASLVKGYTACGFRQQLFFIEYLFIELTPTGQAALVKNWEQVLASNTPLWRDLLRNGTIIGFFLGDELMWNGLPYQSLTEWSNALRHAFPSAFLWENEATPVYSCDPKLPPPTTCPRMYGPCCSYHQKPVLPTNGIPPALNVTSIDMYRWNPKSGPIVPMVQTYYDKYLKPRLHTHQRLFVVPGADASTHNPSCTPSCYDTMCASDAVAFKEWIEQDKTIVGAYPWSWESCGPGCIPDLDEIGCKHMNATKAAWATSGRAIIKVPF